MEPPAHEVNMKTCQIALLGLVGLAVAGCQTDPNTVLLEQENFKQQNENLPAPR